MSEFLIEPLVNQPHVAGQWVSLALPTGPHPPLKRAYSMATRPREDGRLVLAFDHVPGGLGSSYLKELKVGEQVHIQACMGNFILPVGLDPTTPLLFVAHYTGVVPVRGLLEEASQRTWKGPISILYSSPSEKEWIYQSELQNTGLENVMEFRQAVDSLDGEWLNGGWGQHCIATFEKWASRPDTLFYIAGIGNFVRPLRATLKGMGVGRKQIKAQRYD